MFDEKKMQAAAMSVARNIWSTKDLTSARSLPPLKGVVIARNPLAVEEVESNGLAAMHSLFERIYPVAEKLAFDVSQKSSPKALIRDEDRDVISIAYSESEAAGQILLNFRAGDNAVDFADERIGPAGRVGIVLMWWSNIEGRF